MIPVLTLTVHGCCGSSIADALRQAKRLTELLDLAYVTIAENDGFTIYRDGSILHRSKSIKRWASVEAYEESLKK